LTLQDFGAGNTEASLPELQGRFRAFIAILNIRSGVERRHKSEMEKINA
jgi:hypothetical protein